MASSNPMKFHTLNFFIVFFYRHCHWSKKKTSSEIHLFNECNSYVRKWNTTSALMLYMNFIYSRSSNLAVNKPNKWNNPQQLSVEECETQSNEKKHYRLLKKISPSKRNVFQNQLSTKLFHIHYWTTINRNNNAHL